MEASTSDEWTILVVVNGNKDLSKRYLKPSDTTLAKLMHEWKSDCKLFGHWEFTSGNNEITYEDGTITIDMIEETVPKTRIVTLVAGVCDDPMKRHCEIFVYFNERCHQLLVKPDDKLYEVFRRFPGQQKRFEYNGLPLNPNDTVKQAGLKNKSIIHESMCSITVKLSTGCNKVFRISSDSPILHLKERVKSYETDNFSFKYQGRYLKSTESVRQLTQVVEVVRAEFVVHINGRCITWRTKEEPIAFSEFISELSMKTGIDTRELEMMVYVCAGCERRICHSEDYIQQLSVECCKEKSLNLNAVARFCAGTNDWDEHIKCLHEHLVQCRGKGSRTGRSRKISREIKTKLTKEKLDYNVLAQCTDRRLRTAELEAKVQELAVDVEKWKAKNNELKTELKRLQTVNTKSREEIEILTNENKEMDDELEEKLGVKLLVIYDPDNFALSPPTEAQQRVEVQQRGRCPWDTSIPYVKCRVKGLRAGSAPFEQLGPLLQQMFTGHQIRKIRQWRGVVAGKAVAEVTSRADEVARWDCSPYCGSDGAQFSWSEAGKPGGHSICTQGRIFICGRWRRTVLQIER